jgi:hypothetical protein
MSINFTGVTGIEDDYGNVTKITDASGRVLWSSAPPFDGFVYLRPSADISVDSAITLTPADATAAYLLINEEVSDGAATIIEMDYGVFNAKTTASARFSLDGYVPKKITKVTNVYLVVSADGDTAGTKEQQTSYIYPWLILNDTTMYLMRPPTGSMSKNLFGGANFELKECDYVISKKDLASSAQISATTEEMLAEINSYISANGILPNIELQIDMMVDQGEEKDNGYAKVSQAYVVIECE